MSCSENDHLGVFVVEWNIHKAIGSWNNVYLCAAHPGCSHNSLFHSSPPVNLGSFFPSVGEYINMRHYWKQLCSSMWRINCKTKQAETQLSCSDLSNWSRLILWIFLQGWSLLFRFVKINSRLKIRCWLNAEALLPKTSSSASPEAFTWCMLLNIKNFLFKRSCLQTGAKLHTEQTRTKHLPIRHCKLLCLIIQNTNKMFVHKNLKGKT